MTRGGGEIDLQPDVLRIPLLKGSKVVLHSHMLTCDATIDELIAQVDTATGEVLKSAAVHSPEQIKGGNVSTIFASMQAKFLQR